MPRWAIFSLFEVFVDIQLIAVHPTTKVVSLKSGTRLVTGLNELVQVVVLSLFNNPGRDILDPERGSGIPSMIGMNYDTNNMTEILGELTRRIKVTETEVLNAQIGLKLTSASKLRELKLIRVGPGANEGEIEAKIRIINELGQRSEVVI